MVRFVRTCWYVVTMRCEEADRVRAIADPAELSRSERFGESVHRYLCHSCLRARRQLHHLRSLTQSLGDQEMGNDPASTGCEDQSPAPSDAEALSDEAKTRILSALDTPR